MGSSSFGMNQACSTGKGSSISTLMNLMSQLVKSADSNGDGKLSAGEFSKFLKKADTNGDGKLSAQELKSALSGKGCGSGSGDGVANNGAGSCGGGNGGGNGVGGGDNNGSGCGGGVAGGSHPHHMGREDANSRPERNNGHDRFAHRQNNAGGGQGSDRAHGAQQQYAHHNNRGFGQSNGMNRGGNDHDFGGMGGNRNGQIDCSKGNPAYATHGSSKAGDAHCDKDASKSAGRGDQAHRADAQKASRDQDAHVSGKINVNVVVQLSNCETSSSKLNANITSHEDAHCKAA